MAKERDTAADKPQVEKQSAVETPATEAPQQATKIETLSVKQNSPPPDPASDGPGTYRVTLKVGDEARSDEFEAEGRNHAWALFCDSLKSWPSPKRVDRKIERIA